MTRLLLLAAVLTLTPAVASAQLPLYFSERPVAPFYFTEPPGDPAFGYRPVNPMRPLTPPTIVSQVEYKPEIGWTLVLKPYPGSLTVLVDVGAPALPLPPPSSTGYVLPPPVPVGFGAIPSDGPALARGGAYPALGTPGYVLAVKPEPAVRVAAFAVPAAAPATGEPTRVVLR